MKGAFVRIDIHCLMVSGVSLTPLMAQILFDAVCLMLREGRGAKRIKDPEIEGEVRTEFEEGLLGTISGVRFTAIVETEMGKGRVNYLARPIDAASRNKYEWASFASIEDLIDFASHQPSRTAPMYN